MRFFRPPLFSSFLAFFAAGILPVMSSVAHNGWRYVNLPPPVLDGTTSVEKAIQQRRSTRQYRNTSLSLSDLAQLLWAAQGITGTGGKRTAPSAGALYPLQLWVVAARIDGLLPGIYVYDPVKHGLRCIAKGDFTAELSDAALGQSSIRTAAAVLVFSAVYERTTGKYGERGIRYVHIEAGHAAQNVSLQAVSFDIGTLVIGAFHDDRVKAVLHLPARQQPISIMPVGRR